MLCQPEEHSCYRFKNAVVDFGQARNRAEGTIYLRTTSSPPASMMIIYGIALDSATPFSLIVVSDSRNDKAPERKYMCDQETEGKKLWELREDLQSQG